MVNAIPSKSALLTAPVMLIGTALLRSTPSAINSMRVAWKPLMSSGKPLTFTMLYNGTWGLSGTGGLGGNSGLKWGFNLLTVLMLAKIVLVLLKLAKTVWFGDAVPISTC